MKLLTANMLAVTAKHSYGSWVWSKRREAALAKVLSRDPDVACFQEVELAQLGQVQTALGGASASAGNLLVVARNGWRILGQHVIDLKGPKDALAVLVEHEAGARRWVVTVHMSTHPDVRTKQLAVLEASLEDLWDEDGTPLVLCGDFNMPAVSVLEFSDARKIATQVVGGSLASFVGRSISQRRTGRWIDHILVRGLTVGELRLIRTWGASDHNWLMAEVL